MKSLEDALKKIKDDPNKYIGKESMSNLSLFIFGYLISQENEDGTHSEWLAGFQNFIQEKYNITDSIHFSDIIRCFSGSDKFAFDEFYQLYDEFVKTKRQNGK